MNDTVTVEMAMDQADRATKLAAKLASELDEARALLIRALGITTDELEPPMLKEQGDIERAKKMDRKMLEEKYSIARMATRLSMRKVDDLEKKIAGGNRE